GLALGNNNTASSLEYSAAVGRYNTASGVWSTAFGQGNTASGYLATAMGLFNTASGALGSAIGYETTASGIWSSAYGFRSTASGFAALVVGTHADLDGNSGTSPPEEYASASGRGAVAVGGAVHADADYSSAFGVNARATAEGATAIGF